MSSIVENFDVKNNFWEYNPQLKIVFKDIYSKDKSRDKVKSSDLMWGVFLREHPKSDMYNIPEKDELIAKDIIGEPKFKWAEYEDLTQRVINVCFSQAEKSLVEWDKTLRKRDTFIHAQDFTLDEYDEESGKLRKGTADQLDKMLANTNKLYQEYFKIREQMFDEEKIKESGTKVMSEKASGLI